MAYLRTKDLILSLIEIRQIIHSMGYNNPEILTELITQLGIFRRQFEISLLKEDDNDIDIIKINQKLSDFEIKLTEFSVKIKFPVLGEEK